MSVEPIVISAQQHKGDALRLEMVMLTILLFIFCVRGPHFATCFTDPHDSDLWIFRPSESIGRSHHPDTLFDKGSPYICRNRKRLNRKFL
jgi:hypothetical protein